MGKFTDRFMNAFGGSADEDFDEFDDDIYDDDLIEEEDDYEEPEKPASRFFTRKSPVREKETREVNDSPLHEEKKEPAAKNPAGNLFGRGQKDKPAPAPAPARQGGSSRMNNSSEVCVFKPTSIEDSREITETLLEGKAVVVNFEGLHVEISQRIIDFISGSCYALDGNLQKISNYIFIATPSSVDISGDFQDLLSGNDGSFDITGFKSPLL